jgi:AcrR family transcriptional regulator
MANESSHEEPARRSSRQRNRRGEGDKLRSMIIDSAIQILDETGLESSVTIRGVTRHAGIAPQSFYLQFASLSDLLFALYSTGFEELHDSLTRAESGIQDPAERFEALCRTYLEFALVHAGLYRTLTGTVGQLHTEWNAEELPGAAVIALLRDAILNLSPELAEDQAQLRLRTALLMTQLHGMASLMANRPTFPWPPVDAMIARVIATEASRTAETGAS